jgi:hypothetical protein
VQDQEGNEKSQGHNHEEWQTGNSGYLPCLWHQDLPHRQEPSSQRLVDNLFGGFHANLCSLMVLSGIELLEHDGYYTSKS